MNISYNWLKDLIDLDLAPDELGKRLTGVGLAVEGIEAHGDDHVLDIDLTSNRPDCLSHLGVAREIRAITNRELRVSNAGAGEVPVPLALAGDTVLIDDHDLCHRFTARIIRNVKIGPSPQWLVDRLEAIGERSINNVADITNYVMHELGQPMHSFDLDKLAGGRIVVRRANDGETITTLDEVERQLDNTMLAICDAVKPVAVAGVMGSLDSSITETTSNVLLEVAYFKRENIRHTSRRLNLNTEASYRFERGVDIDNLAAASDRAAGLICELAGGEAGDFVDVYVTRPETVEIPSPDISGAVKRLTGLEVGTDDCIRILNSLGISNETDAAVFAPPSWRHDLSITEDLVEEIARHIGYEQIESLLPPAFGAGEYQHNEIREKQLRQTLVDMGFDEAISYSFIDTRFDDVFEPLPELHDDRASERYVTLQDAVIEGAVRMRASLLPGLLDAVRLNLNHQQRNLKLFEAGKVFAPSTGEKSLPNEQEAFALVITGSEVAAGRASTIREFDFYDAKGAVEVALAAASITGVSYAPVDIKHLRRGQSASISANGRQIGSVGRLDDALGSTYKFRQAVYVAEINLQSALLGTAATISYEPLPKYPGIIRDISFVVDRNIEFGQIRSSILEQAVELCRNVMFVDIYEGKGLAEHERSITVRIEYRSDERTLVEDEVEGLHSKIISAVQSGLGINVRY